MLHNVDREALLCRLAHCSAYQLLVAGVFNGKKFLNLSFLAIQWLSHANIFCTNFPCS